MFLATVNKAKQLLFLTYIGDVKAEELRQAREEATELMADLGPGFRVLADFIWMESMDAASAGEIGKMMELCDERGVSEVVRVIPDPKKDIGLNILAVFHYRRRLPMVTCENMAEAIKELKL